MANMIKEKLNAILAALTYRQKMFLLVMGGLVVGLGGLFMYLLRMHTYLTDDPAACVNCHIMTPYYATWMHSSHARDATCNDCHVPHNNIFAKYFFKAKDGMNHVRKFVTFNERQAITAEDASAGVIMDNCIRCHTQLNQEFVNTGMISYVDTKNGKGKACWDCHTDVPHTKRSSLASTPDAIAPLPKSPVPDWLKNMMGSKK